MSGHSKATTQTIIGKEPMAICTTTSCFLVIVVFDSIDLSVRGASVNQCLLILNGYRGMIHHLFATSCDTNNLTIMSSFFDETIKFLTHTFHEISTFGKVTTIFVTCPVINCTVVTSGVTITSVTAMAISQISNVIGEFTTCMKMRCL